VDNYIVLDVISKQSLELTKEGAGYAANGTPEYQYASALVPDEVTGKPDIEAKVGAQIAKIGFAKAMGRKWVKLTDDKQSVVRIAADLVDEDMNQLCAYQKETDPANHDKKTLDMLKKRKLVTVTTAKSYKVTKGTDFAPERVKLETNLTADMLRSGAWKDTKFKKANLNAAGQVPSGGHLHPLLKVRT
jgi:phenylalanyl-tRNA synthetase alpha chain